MSDQELHPKTPDYMLLPKMRFKLSLEEFHNDVNLKSAFLSIITRNSMTKYYEDVCKEFDWEIDNILRESMNDTNEIMWQELESKVESNLDDTVKENWREMLEFACEIGDFDKALEISTSIFEDTSKSTSIRAEAAFAIFRIAYLKNNLRTMNKIITDLNSLMEGNCSSGSDWCCRNKLKVYEAVYSLATRNFARAASLLLDCIPTFESYELLTFKDLVEYTILAGMISLSRSELDQQFDKNGLLQQALLTQSPKYREYFLSLYNCHYAEFFRNLAWIENEMRENPLLHPHYRYYVREVRLKAYSQLLQAYRSLSLCRMATEFGVTEQYLEQDIARFIANGRLHCKIDKVSGAIVTLNSTGCDGIRAPDVSCDREFIYQNTIKRGDALLNRVKKLGRVIDF